MTDHTKAGDGWVFEAWRVCSACQGRSTIHGQSAYNVLGSAGSCACDRHDDPLKRVGQERKTFGTRAELSEFLASLPPVPTQRSGA